MRGSYCFGVLAAAVVLLSGCGDDRVSRAVGARCDFDRECDEECHRGDDYPGGFCSVSCRTDDDCPEDTVCAPQREGGICLFPCTEDAGCKWLGATWECKSQVGASSMVCLGD